MVVEGGLRCPSLEEDGGGLELALVEQGSATIATLLAVLPGMLPMCIAGLRAGAVGCCVAEGVALSAAIDVVPSYSCRWPREAGCEAW